MCATFLYWWYCSISQGKDGFLYREKILTQKIFPFSKKINRRNWARLVMCSVDMEVDVLHILYVSVFEYLNRFVSYGRNGEFFLRYLVRDSGPEGPGSKPALDTSLPSLGTLKMRITLPIRMRKQMWTQIANTMTSNSRIEYK